MRIGMIGSRKIGGTLARLFARAGNEVAIANSRGPDSLQELVEEFGERAQATTVEETTAFGDVVILAIPWRLREELPAGERFAGKVVVDAMNPYGANGVIDVEPSTSSEEVARSTSSFRSRRLTAISAQWAAGKQHSTLAVDAKQRTKTAEGGS